MPFRSLAQKRKMFELEQQGKVKPGTTKRWEKETPKGRQLPEKVSKLKPTALDDLRAAAKKRLGK